MATMVQNRPVDLNGPEAAARQHAQAVTRNYISQPRLSMYCSSAYVLLYPATSQLALACITPVQPGNI